jgi:hypothetical protein
MTPARCLFCGEPVKDGGDLLHRLHCDGRQGRVEAAVPDPGAWRRVRVTDPDTSHDAAALDRARDRDRAYAALARAPEGLTDFELGAAIGRQQTSAGKRRGELRDAGLVVDSGERRPAPSGSRAIVWRLVEAVRRGSRH